MKYSPTFVTLLFLQQMSSTANCYCLRDIISMVNVIPAENRSVPDCSGVVTACAFVTVNLLIEHFEMSVYYYYYFTHCNQVSVLA